MSSGGPPGSSRAGGVLLLVLAALVTWWPRHTGAQPPVASAGPPTPSASAGPTPTSEASSTPPELTKPAEPPPAPESPKITALRELVERIDALLEGTLDVGVDPKTLFDIDIDDVEAVKVEARRLAAVVERAKRDVAEAAALREAQALASASASASAAPPPVGPGKRVPPPTRAAPSASPAPSASVAPSASASASAAPDPKTIEYEELRNTDEASWRARIALDEARLRFYRLPTAERVALLAQHTERQQADRRTKSEQAMAQADRDAEQAEKDKQVALEAAAQSRSEAERAVHEEHARLLGIIKLQAEYKKELTALADAIQLRSDEALGERRKITEALERQRSGVRDAAAMDLMYVELRARLREARSGLSQALDVVSSDESRVPVAGVDPLVGIPADIDRSKVDAQRVRVTEEAEKLRIREAEIREERARLLMTEVELLNRTRLSMLPFLSAAKRDDATGFGPEGFDHARAELLQVWLTVRYHHHATTVWVAAVQSGDERGESAWAATIIVLKWMAPLAAFIWWRRRAEGLLDGWRDAAREARKRLAATHERDRVVSLLSFVKRVRRPLEWLLLLWSALWLSPNALRQLLEVELLATTFSWTLGGALVVSVIDALSSDEVRGPRRALSATQTAHLRLRSLRVVGRVVVTVGLILSLSDKLVGKGTIYSWVLSTCWFAALPIVVFIVSWWRPVIWERMELLRKKGRFESWVLSRREGATSFLAAVAGGGFLFGLGVWRVLRGWVVAFNVTRRVLAYLFRRGMSKKASEGEKLTYAPITQAAHDLLGPEAPSDEIVPSVADEQVQHIIERIDAPGGGIFAIVGERGAGKSTIIDRIVKSSDRVVRVNCPLGGVEAFLQALNVAMSLDEHASFEVATELLESAGDDSAVLVDDAHLLIRPMMGGLSDFDRVLELARSSSSACTWVFAIDLVLWRFLERARGAQPLFDDVVHLAPWREEGIVRLLTHRNQVAGIAPIFDALVGDLDEDADELDRLEALQRTEASYYRLLWDYAAGNPGVALHFWRKSLGVAPDGSVHVRLFSAPDASDLQGVPDSTVFVLRATIQLGWGTLDEIRGVTALPLSEVRDTLRHGVAMGYFVHRDGRYQVTWAWFRAITRFLQRRHLLFTH